MPGRHPLRVQILQPVVPAYRVPLFEALSSLPELELEVHAAERHGELESTHSGYRPSRIRPLFGGRLFWQSAKLSCPTPDVLVVSGNARWLSNYPLILRARRRGASIVWWGQGWSVGSSELSLSIRARLARLADVALLYNDAEIEMFSRHGFPRSRLAATNNTVDTRTIERLSREWTSERLAAFRTEHGLDPATLLFSGRLVASKRLDLAFDALGRLWHEGLRFSLAVIGEGPLKSPLKSRADALGFARAVCFAGAEWREEQLAPWFLSALAQVHPGQIGLGLLHSFAYGLPVVTHGDYRRHGPEIHALEPGVNGLCFKEGDVNDLARALRSILVEPARAARLAAGARATVQRDYSFDAMVSRFRSALFLSRKVAERRRSPGPE
jgi:glycosyltransferase involved in cell wall biosynthesis